MLKGRHVPSYDEAISLLATSMCDDTTDHAVMSAELTFVATLYQMPVSDVASDTIDLWKTRRK